MENNNTFQYRYSSEQQQEIRHIRSKYLPPEEDKMETLRKLHYSSTRKAQSASIAVGVVGALTFGTGMSLILTGPGAVLGAPTAMALGVVTGLAGLILIALAYPIYNRVLKKNRDRNAPEILRLTEELLK